MLAARTRRLIRAARIFGRFFIGFVFFAWVVKLGFGVAGLLSVLLAVCFSDWIEFGWSVGFTSRLGGALVLFVWQGLESRVWVCPDVVFGSGFCSRRRR